MDGLESASDNEVMDLGQHADQPAGDAPSWTDPSIDMGLTAGAGKANGTAAGSQHDKHSATPMGLAPRAASAGFSPLRTAKGRPVARSTSPAPRSQALLQALATGLPRLRSFVEGKTSQTHASLSASNSSSCLSQDVNMDTDSLAFARTTAPQTSQPNNHQSQLHSALDLESTQDTCDTDMVEDPAEARVFDVAHMFVNSPHESSSVSFGSSNTTSVNKGMNSSQSLQQNALHRQSMFVPGQPQEHVWPPTSSKRTSWMTRSPDAGLYCVSLPSETALQTEAEVPLASALAAEVIANDAYETEEHHQMDVGDLIDELTQNAMWIEDGAMLVDDDVEQVLDGPANADASTVSISYRHVKDQGRMDVDGWTASETTGHEELRRKRSLAGTLPAEVLFQIFSYFDPTSRDSTSAFLSPASTVAALRECAMVCRWWNRLATCVLWRRPLVFDAARFEKLVCVAETADKAHSQLEQPKAGGSDNLETRVTSTTLYPDLIQHLSLSQTLSEPHRYAHRLSPLLVRLVSLPSLNLTTLDLGFCKGVSNFALQRCAHHLKSLLNLNLAGGGRSEICVIKIATECRKLKRLGLGWNSAVTDFCIREVGRWCTELEWIDLSGCYGVGDAGVVWLVRGLTASISNAGMQPATVKFSGAVRRAVSPSSPSAATTLLPLPPPPSFPPPPFLRQHETSPSSQPTASSTTHQIMCTSLTPTFVRHPTTKLRHINLSYCQNITATAVFEIIDKCRASIGVINMVGCGDVAAIRCEISGGVEAVPTSSSSQPSQMNGNGGTPVTPVITPALITPDGVFTTPTSRPATIHDTSATTPSTPSTPTPPTTHHHNHHNSHQQPASLDIGRLLHGTPDGRRVLVDVPGFVPFWSGIGI
ncbi:uncharacterized protein EV422DRAFT_407696 [Fimicolochytrium jonesii]|uniref:uncharacterized protein n=1 Tax=Fimicolochytrium jonesii TaxID=1396493 RepID=UPI0022FE6C9B|nr:uncharacterized protein EV422DRAFT_407696 [Fimicolochytrium jonesii]KAI8822626.1 hypothetical protein EV422DRAFT_407696 [Fimicolochytrium jonesii]